MAQSLLAPTSDVIEVRPDERFDSARVADYLRGKFPGSERALSVRQFAGGHANLTYLLRYGEGEGTIEYVLRRPPLGPVAPGSHDMSREHRVLSVLWKAFPLAPRSFVFCDDVAILGAPFFVMERRHGVVVRGAIPPAFGGGADETSNRMLSQVVVDVLAEFHAVEPAKAELGDLGRPEGFLARQVKGWTERFERAHRRDDIGRAQARVHGPLAVHREAVLGDVVLQGRLDVHDAPDLVHLLLELARVLLQELDALPPNAHLERLCAVQAAGILERGHNSYDRLKPLSDVVLD